MFSGLSDEARRAMDRLSELDARHEQALRGLWLAIGFMMGVVVSDGPDELWAGGCVVWLCVFVYEWHIRIRCQAAAALLASLAEEEEQ